MDHICTNDYLALIHNDEARLSMTIGVAGLSFAMAYGGRNQMRRYHHLVEGILRPEEIDSLQRIFDVVIAQPWFNLNEVNREAFAAELIKLYRSGVIDFMKLHQLAALTAIGSFSRDIPEEEQRALSLFYEGQIDWADGKEPFAQSAAPRKISDDSNEK